MSGVQDGGSPPPSQPEPLLAMLGGRGVRPHVRNSLVSVAAGGGDDSTNVTSGSSLPIRSRVATRKRRRAQMASVAEESAVNTSPATATGDVFVAPDDDDSLLDILEIPNDVFLAFENQRLQNMTKEDGLENTPPMVLRTQLYATVAERAQVDKELVRMKASGTVRIFQIHQSQNEVAIVRTEDYIRCIELVLSSLPKTSSADQSWVSAERKALEGFRDHVLPRYLEVSITKEELMRAIPFRSSTNRSRDCISGAKPSRQQVGWEALKVLMREGFLVHHPTVVDMFWFAVPRSGRIWKYVRDGAKEIATKLRRRDYHEAPLRDIETSRLRRSFFNASFHIKQMVGAGLLEVISSTSGDIVRLVDHDSE